MASTATTRLRLEKQATGENVDTWGTKLNTGLDLIDFAFGGKTSVTLAGSTVVLTSNNFATDEARAMFLDVSGTTGTIEVPAVGKVYVVRAASSLSNTVGIKPTGGSTVYVFPGQLAWIVVDGTTPYVVSRSGWGKIESGSVGTGTELDIPLNSVYAVNDLSLLLKGVSHNSGSQALSIALHNGTNFTSNQALSAATFGTSAVLYGSIEMFNLRRGTGRIFSSFADLSSDHTMGTLAANSIAWRDAAITQIRLYFGGSNFDAGTYELWAR